MDWNVWMGAGVILGSILLTLYNTFFVQRSSVRFFVHPMTRDDFEYGIDVLKGTKKKKKKKLKAWYKRIPPWMYTVLGGIILATYEFILKLLGKLLNI